LRDGDACWLCGDLMVFEKVGALGDRASIDHVVPLSRGGLHELGNCRLAHHRCNAGRGNKW
jgi:5-methylcytosine-specific restriction endonuclease McrA